MQSTISEVSLLTIIISTIIILIFGGVIIHFLFLYQRKKYKHKNEVIEMKENFSKMLLQSKFEIQEQTLDHIAKELHANIGHLASLININLSEILAKSKNENQENILETKSLTKQLLSELKALSASLNTDHIMHIGFEKAFTNEIARLNKTKKYQVSISKIGDEYRLIPEHETILFRLSQEILNNILKYSEANTITILLNYAMHEFELKISDDGIGFDENFVNSQSAAKESTGLINMQKRANLIGGSILIKSKISKGTEITISIPN
jgi:signal transduction histidine kinase